MHNCCGNLFWLVYFYMPFPWRLSIPWPTLGALPREPCSELVVRWPCVCYLLVACGQSYLILPLHPTWECRQGRTGSSAFLCLFRPFLRWPIPVVGLSNRSIRMKSRIVVWHPFCVLSMGSQSKLGPRFLKPGSSILVATSLLVLYRMVKSLCKRICMWKHVW